MKYSCRIEDDLLACSLTPDVDLIAPVFCCSGMAPLEVVSGGEGIRALGSYLEIQLPDLAAGKEHRFEIRYAQGHSPANRAWMPLGPYLRAEGQVIELPPTPSGRRPAAVGHTEAWNGLPIVPQPTTWEPSGGSLTTDGFSFDHPALQAVAALADRQSMPFRGSTPLEFKNCELPQDAYEILIEPNGITISAGTYGGFFYAGITLMTLLQSGPLPCGRISDEPRFAWRGQHLDTARHYYEPQTIMALLDLMAQLKLNRFHWHFADDEAFRVEVECYPELWQKTALRGEGQMLPGIFAGEPVSGGSYSKSTVREIIDHASALNIKVLPEIEVPAHALAITTLFPGTTDPDDMGPEKSVQGYSRNVMNPAMPETWELVTGLIAEIASLFPFERLHVGCDELPEDTWLGSPLAVELMGRERLTSTQDLQGWMMERVAQIVLSHGKKPAAWEEAAQGANGGIGHDALLFSWTGQGPGLEAARRGYDVVMTPAQHLYFDMAHTDDLDDWGASWAAFVDLEDTMSWVPVPDDALKQRIAGVQGAFWSEFTTQDDQIWPMLMPRMLGLSAMAWQLSPPIYENTLALSALYCVEAGGRLSIA